MLTIMHTYDNCGSVEERVFSDTWSGLDLCLMCLTPVIGRIHTNPCSDGDNLRSLLREES